MLWCASNSKGREKKRTVMHECISVEMHIQTGEHEAISRLGLFHDCCIVDLDAW